MVRNIGKTIREYKNFANDRYDLTAGNIQDLLESAKDPYTLISHAFEFGYVQGWKANMAELRTAMKIARGGMTV